MKRYRRLLAISLAMFVVGWTPATATATYGVDQWRVYLYMLPPADALGNNACLTQRWHSTDPNYEYMKALDWKATCGSTGTEIVRFRALGVDVDNFGGGTSWQAMEGVEQQLTQSPCGTGHVHIAEVAIWSVYGTSLGGMIYAHTVVHGQASSFNIPAQGATISAGYLTSFGFGDTVSDAGAGTSCWKAWHVHENNLKNDLFDSWHSLYNTASTCDCYTNNSSANWIRRLYWIHTAGE